MGTSNKELPSPAVTFISIMIGLGIRWFVANTYTAYQLKQYPHFTTPLNDVRELREMFYTYEKKGKFFTAPSQVG